MDHDQQTYTLAQRAQRQAVRKRKARQQAAIRRLAQEPITPTEQRLSPTQRTGRSAETQAARHVTETGLRLLGRNMCCKAGEIDLIATDGTTLVFIEVRRRQSPHYGGAAASVNRHKQRRLIRAARYFLPQLTQRHFGGLLPPCRFDVISIEPSGLVWIKQAFCGS